MSRIRVALAVGIASVALAGMAGCSKPSETPPAASANSSDETAEANNTTSSATTTNTTTTAESNAAAPAAPAAGMIPLDIKDASGAPVSGDPVDGKEVFQQCSVCHSIEAGVNKVGPSLHGIIGRHSGIAPNFNYSSANKNSGIVWTEQNIYQYLNNPQKMVPGTYMTFTGVQDPQKRADVIAYLQENTK
jgi:cytochrome c